MVAWRVRAVTVLQKHSRGWLSRRALGSKRQTQGKAWELYRTVPTATELVYKKVAEAKLREERWQQRTIAIATKAGAVVRTMATRPAPHGGRTPYDDGAPGEMALATTPATPLHLLMRAAREDGFRLPAIQDVRSHSPALGEHEWRQPRKGAGGGEGRRRRTGGTRREVY